MRLFTRIVILILAFLVISCDRDRSLNPPENSEKIIFEVKVPSEIDVLPLRILYRSNICKKKESNSNGDAYEIPGYNIVKESLSSKGSEGLQKLQVPYDGGGACDWKLSNITVNFKFNKPQELGDNITENSPARAIFTLDENIPQITNGTFSVIEGDQEITGDYYPVIVSYHSPEKKNVLSMRKENYYIYYRVKKTGRIKFSPVIHTDKVVKASQPEGVGLRNNYKVIYPDGTVESSQDFPDFKRLRAMQ